MSIIVDKWKKTFVLTLSARDLKSTQLAVTVTTRRLSRADVRGEAGGRPSALQDRRDRGVVRLYRCHGNLLLRPGRHDQEHVWGVCARVEEFNSFVPLFRSLTFFSLEGFPVDQRRGPRRGVSLHQDGPAGLHRPRRADLRGGKDGRPDGGRRAAAQRRRHRGHGARRGAHEVRLQGPVSQRDPYYHFWFIRSNNNNNNINLFKGNHFIQYSNRDIGFAIYRDLYLYIYVFHKTYFLNCYFFHNNISKKYFKKDIKKQKMKKI